MAHLCHAFCCGLTCRPLLRMAGRGGVPGCRGSASCPPSSAASWPNIGTCVCLPPWQDEWPITSARFTPDRKPVILTQVQFRSKASAACALQ